MTESEVADSYRNRFDFAKNVDSRLSELLSEGKIGMDLEDRTWLASWLVPGQAGSMEISMATLSHFREFAGPHYVQRPNGVGVFRSGAGLDVSTGMRRVTITTGFDPDRMLATYAYAELHADGSGFVASLMWRKREATPRPQVFDEVMATSLLGQLDLLVKHAIDNCKAGGDAAVAATLLGPESGDEADTGLLLVHSRQGFSDALGSRPLTTAPISRHSMSLDAAYNTGSELVSIASLLMSDLVQAFGLAESLQLTRDGTIRRQYLERDARTDVESWASERNIELTDETA